jgi:predicted TIM-barrel fold metal-dependent hydrolase
MRKIIVGVIILSFIEVGSIYAQTDKNGYIDTHVHLNVQSRQMGRRRGGQRQASSAANYEMAAEQLLADMDYYGAQKALIMPPPQVPEQGAVCDYKDLIGVAQKHPGRIFFLGGGDTLNRLIHQYKPSEVTAEVRAEFNNIAEEIISSGAKGFGEMAVLHLSLINSRHAFEEADADHPLFLLLADIAASHNVPIDLHMEAVPQDMQLPEGLNRNSQKNPPILHANIPALERLLSHNKKTMIVWQHIGWDNTGWMTVELLRRLLETHPNLYLSMRGEKRIYDMNGQLKPNRIIDVNGEIHPEWFELISDFPDRFMVGTDDFFGAAINTASGKSLPTTSYETWGIVNQLPPELAEKVGRSNAARVYNL